MNTYFSPKFADMESTLPLLRTCPHKGVLYPSLFDSTKQYKLKKIYRDEKLMYNDDDMYPKWLAVSIFKKILQIVNNTY